MILFQQNVRGSGHPALPVPVRTVHPGGRSGGLKRKGGEILKYKFYFEFQILTVQIFLLLKTEI